jgi:hypothetical protein
MDAPLDLTYEEIKKITGYSRADCQLRVLEELHIPARRRRDNSVLVMRMHCQYPTTAPMPADAPRLKSARK